MSSLLLYPKPLQGNRPASFLQQWHQKLTHPFNEMYWYGTPGPTLHGMPTPNGLASRYISHFGFKLKEISTDVSCLTYQEL